VIELKFVNREEELKTLHELANKGTTLPIYLYGPEGCGKTRLLKEFIKKVNGVALYIDALEGEDPEKALLTTPLNILTDIVKDLIKEVAKPVGQYLCLSLWKILKHIETKLQIRGKPLIIAVDDITRAIGLSKVEWYTKWLYELIKKLQEDYRPSSILIIATTSEGKSLDLVMRHTYTHINLVWNLDKEAHQELIQQLKPPKNIDPEQLWYYTGGNPRATIDIAENNWNIDSWIQKIEAKLRPLIRTIRSLNLTNELQKLIEDPDNIEKQPSQKMEQLYTILVEANLFMYKGFRTINGKHIPKNPELGIGEYYAWQIPAYKHALEQLLQR